MDARAIVSAWQPASDEDIQATQALLRRGHEMAAAEAPATAPALDIAAATWGVSVLYWGTCLFVDRASNQTALPADLADWESRECEPSRSTACRQWSVDLSFRFLPSLILRCQKIATEDHLSLVLNDLAKRWPLAQVGVLDLCGKDFDFQTDRLQVIADDECLLGVMVDRILKHKCSRLLNNPLFADRIRRAIGAHENLAGWARQDLQSINQDY